MSHYRRCYVPGGSFFFTVVTERRAPILGNDLTRDLLRAAFRDCLHRWPPFRVDAMVMLRDRGITRFLRSRGNGWGMNRLSPVGQGAR
jgi:REP element-mobilizing transposase RayT